MLARDIVARSQAKDRAAAAQQQQQQKHQQPTGQTAQTLAFKDTRSVKLRTPLTPARLTTPHMMRLNAIRPMSVLQPDDRTAALQNAPGLVGGRDGQLSSGGGSEDVTWAHAPPAVLKPQQLKGNDAPTQVTNVALTPVPEPTPYDALIASLFNGGGNDASSSPRGTNATHAPRLLPPVVPPHRHRSPPKQQRPVVASTTPQPTVVTSTSTASRLGARRSVLAGLPRKGGGAATLNSDALANAASIDDVSILDPAFQRTVMASSYESALGLNTSNPNRVMRNLRSSLQRIDGIITALNRQQRFTQDADAVSLRSGMSSDDDGSHGDEQQRRRSTDYDPTDPNAGDPLQPRRRQTASDLAQEVKELKLLLSVLVNEASQHREAMAAVELNELKFHQMLKEAQNAATAAAKDAADARAELERVRAARDAAVSDCEMLTEKLAALKSRGGAGGVSFDDGSDGGMMMNAGAEALLSSDVDAADAIGGAGSPRALTATTVGFGSATGAALLNASSAASGGVAPSGPALLPARYFAAPRFTPTTHPEGGLTFICIGVQGYQSLMEHFAEHMAMACDTFHAVVVSCVAKFAVTLYKAASECRYLIASPTTLLAIDFAVTLQMELLEQCWPQQLESSADAGRVEDSEMQPFWYGLRARIGIAMDTAANNTVVVGDPTQPCALEYVSPATEAAVILCRIACGGMIATSVEVANVAKLHVQDLGMPSISIHLTLTSAVETRDVYSICPLALAERAADFQRLVATSVASIPGAADLVEEDIEPAESGVITAASGVVGAGPVSELELLLGRVQTAHSRFKPVPTSEGLVPTELLHPDPGTKEIAAAGLPMGRLTFVVVRMFDPTFLDSPSLDEDTVEITLGLVQGAVDVVVRQHRAAVIRQPLTRFAQLQPEHSLLSNASFLGGAASGVLPPLLNSPVSGPASPPPFITSSPLGGGGAASGPTARQYWVFAVSGAADHGLQFATDLDAALLRCDWPREILTLANCDAVEWKGTTIFNGPRFCYGVHPIPRTCTPYCDPYTREVRFIGDDVLIANRLCDLASGGQCLLLEDNADCLLKGVAPRPVMLPIQLPISITVPNRKQNLLLVVARDKVGRCFTFHGMTAFKVWSRHESYIKLRNEINRHDARWDRRASCISLITEPRDAAAAGNYIDAGPIVSFAYGLDPPRLGEDFRTLTTLASHFARAAHRVHSESGLPYDFPMPTVQRDAAVKQLEAIETACMHQLDAAAAGTVVDPAVLQIDPPALRGFFDSIAFRAATMQKMSLLNNDDNESLSGGGGGGALRRRSSTLRRTGSGVGANSMKITTDPATPLHSRRGSMQPAVKGTAAAIQRTASVTKPGGRGGGGDSDALEMTTSLVIGGQAESAVAEVVRKEAHAEVEGVVALHRDIAELAAAVADALRVSHATTTVPITASGSAAAFSANVSRTDDPLLPTTDAAGTLRRRLEMIASRFQQGHQGYLSVSGGGSGGTASPAGAASPAASTTGLPLPSAQQTPRHSESLVLGRGSRRGVPSLHHAVTTGSIRRQDSLAASAERPDVALAQLLQGALDPRDLEATVQHGDVLPSLPGTPHAFGGGGGGGGDSPVSALAESHNPSPAVGVPSGSGLRRAPTLHRAGTLQHVVQAARHQAKDREAPTAAQHSEAAQMDLLAMRKARHVATRSILGHLFKLAHVALRGLEAKQHAALQSVAVVTDDDDDDEGAPQQVSFMGERVTSEDPKP